MRPLVLFFVALTTAAAFVACGDDNGSPSPTGPSTFVGPPRTIQISGNLVLSGAGQTSQLTATATFVNDSTKDVTRQVTWQVSNPSIATITTTGLLRAIAVGEAQVTASLRGVTSEARAVSVKPVVTVTKNGIVGPAQMTPGSVEQFTATQQLSDGSTRDITATASWSSSNSNVLRHVGTGRFEARTPGEATPQASIDRQFVQGPSVLILPTGTFKLSGTVRDQGGELDSAKVELVSGTGAPKSVTTFGGGKYAFYGVAGEVRLRVSAPGYQVEESVETVTDHAVHDFRLSTTKPVVDVSGSWTLKVAASGCSSGWPDAVRRAEVTAVIAQQDTRFTMTFSGPTLQKGTPSTGRIAGDVFSIWIYGDSYYYREYSLLDRPTTTDWVGVYGLISGTASPSVVNGSFDGWFDYYRTAANATFLTGFPVSCRADAALDLRR